MNAKIVAVFLVLVGCAMAQRVKETYKPFNYNYESTDEFGNAISEDRSQDASGVMTGTFLYRLVSGIFRNARYEATPTGGFRIVIDTNEPGMGSDSPASATYNVQAPPPGSYDVPKRRTY